MVLQILAIEHEIVHKLTFILYSIYKRNEKNIKHYCITYFWQTDYETTGTVCIISDWFSVKQAKHLYPQLTFSIFIHFGAVNTATQIKPFYSLFKNHH